MEPKKRQPKKTSEKPKATEKPKNKFPGRKGHSEQFKKEMFEKLIEWFTQGKSLRSFCSNFNISAMFVLDLVELSEENRERYARACEIRSTILFEEIQDIARRREEDHTPFTGSNVIQRDKLIIDSLKWQLSKMQPKKYSDRIEVDQKTEHSGSINIPITGMVIKSSEDKSEEK